MWKKPSTKLVMKRLKNVNILFLLIKWKRSNKTQIIYFSKPSFSISDLEKFYDTITVFTKASGIRLWFIKLDSFPLFTTLIRNAPPILCPLLGVEGKYTDRCSGHKKIMWIRNKSLVYHCFKRNPHNGMNNFKIKWDKHDIVILVIFKYSSFKTISAIYTQM